MDSSLLPEKNTAIHAELIDLIEEAVIVASRSGIIEQWNAGAVRMMGWSPDEALGKPLETVCEAAALAVVLERILSGPARWSGELGLIRKGGEKAISEAVALFMTDGRLLFSLRDVTYRKQRDQQLLMERRLLRTVIDGIPDVIFLKDKHGRHLMRNEAQRRLTGLPDEAVLGRTVLEMGFSPEQARQYWEDDQHVLTTGQPVENREEPFQLQDGRSGWFLTSKYPIRDAQGQVAGLVGIARDVTLARRQAAELAETRMRLSAHLDHFLLAVIECDADFRIIRWCGRAAQMFGWEAEEMIGKHLAEVPIVHPSDRSEVEAMFFALRSGRETSNTHENRNLDRLGRTLHCTWHNSVLRGEDGIVRSYLCLAQDVTAQVEAVQRLRDSDRLLATLIDATNIGYALLDAQGRILTTNEKYLPFFGVRNATEIVGRSVTDFIPQEQVEFFRSMFEQVLRDGSAGNMEIDLAGEGGRVAPFEYNAKVEHAADGPRIHVFCRDISERRQMQAERQVIERKLLETQKLESLGVLAGGIAHDFNNILTGILGNASIAASILGPESPVHTHLEQVEKAAMRAADLCRQMLAYSGKGRFAIASHDLNHILKDTSNLLTHSVSKRARLEFHLAPSLPLVLADGSQLRQVIMNLVINASDAIGERDGRILVSSGTVYADAAYLATARSAGEVKPGRYVWFEVADNGCGMSPEVISRIFDPFFTTKFTGRGLGLAAVLGIVRSHRGAMFVESTVGCGTSFRVLLPASAAENPTSETPSAILRKWRTTGTAIIVDDEETVRVTCRRMLEGIGMTVLTAVDGRDALAKFQARHDIRLVLLDLTMPNMDGAETYRELQRLRPGIAVVVMSGFPEQEAMRKFEKRDSTAFVQKPFSVAQLAEKIRSCLPS